MALPDIWVGWMKKIAQIGDFRKTAKENFMNYDNKALSDWMDMIRTFMKATPEDDLPDDGIDVPTISALLVIASLLQEIKEKLDAK